MKKFIVVFYSGERKNVAGSKISSTDDNYVIHGGAEHIVSAEYKKSEVKCIIPA